MQTYELTFLVNKDDQVKKLEDLIESLNGKITKKDDWGVKTLAYPIKKITSAHYYNWTLEMSGPSTQKLRTTLNFNDDMIRFLLLKVEA